MRMQASCLPTATEATAILRAFHLQDTRSFFDKNENRMFKFIENLEVKGNNYINLIRNLFYSVERKKELSLKNSSCRKSIIQ